MTFSTFNSTQLDEITRILAVEVPDSNGTYAPLYDYIYSQITDPVLLDEPLDGVDKSVWLWVKGAIGVNSNDNEYFSDFIREYTSQQYLLRKSTPLDLADLQLASNKIAEAFAKDILNEPTGVNPTHALPTLDRIRDYDAGQTAAEIFDDNFSPWAGTLLFPFLES